MPKFRYKAVALNGEILDGIQEAHSESEVLIILKDKGYTPIKIIEHIDSLMFKDFFTFQKVKAKDLSVFCREFYFTYNAGITIISCLDILRKQIENKKLKSTLDSMYSDVQKGEHLSETMKKNKNVFPELLIHMVEVGELTGNLDTIMNKMALHYDKESKLQNQIKSAMIYPTILGIASIIVLFFLLTFVIPNFVSMFESSGTELPGPTRILIYLSEFAKRYWYIIFITLILLIYLFKILGKSNFGRLLFDTFKTKIPIVNRATEKIVSSRFSSTLSILLSSGIPLIEAIHIVSKVVRNKIAENGLLKTSEELEKGLELADPLQRINFFPPLVVSTIRVGEYSGTLDNILEKLADFYDSEVESAIQSLIAVLEPLMIIIMALLIGSIVIAMVLPMFDIGQTI